MQDKISSIALKNPKYKLLTLDNLVTEKNIYKNGQFCTVQIVHIQEINQENQPIFQQQIKNIKYALKIISKSKIKTKAQDDYQRQYQYVFNQIYALYLIKHPNVVQIYWHFEDKQNIYILMEYAGKNMLKYIKNKNLEEEKIKNIFKQICQGVSALHSQKIMHRDLSLENFVIDTKTEQVKIIDLGNAIEFTGGRTTALGSLQMMAPQVQKQKKYNSKADIWSLGVVLYELFHNRNPFINENEDYSQDQLLQKIDKLQYEIDDTKVSQQAKKLITRMLQLNPQHRPNIQQVLSSKWITGIQERGNQKLIHSNYLAEQDQKTKQLPNRKSLFALSENQSSNPNPQKGHSQKHIEKGFKQQEDFYCDNKMSLDNSVAELQQRLRILIKIRANQLFKKKELTLKLLQIQKEKIQDQRCFLQKQKLL